jgi:GTP-binding protein EngB required for normal cell division
MFDAIKDFINPGKNPDLSSAHDYQNSHLPTLWLLGKTGAGKSSFIQALTGLSEVEVGNGFAPCTMTSSAYEFPQDTPVLRFLDTRGLGEANYDPTEDIRICADQGHALIIVAKVDEPEQSSVINALKQIRKQSDIKHLLVVHTAINSVSESDRKRMMEHNQQQFESAWGKPVKSVDVDFDCESQDFYHREGLIEMLSEMLPIVGLMVKEKEYANLEEQNFDKLPRASLLGFHTALPILNLELLDSQIGVLSENQAILAEPSILRWFEYRIASSSGKEHPYLF